MTVANELNNWSKSMFGIDLERTDSNVSKPAKKLTQVKETKKFESKLIEKMEEKIENDEHELNVLKF